MNLGNRHSQHSFAQIPSVNMARSKFDRSFSVKDTFDFDYLVPCFVDEILPGDTVNLNLTTFARLATQVKPVMDNMYIDFHFFFVPNRLVWDNWEKFMGAQENPGDPIDFLIPQITPEAGGFQVNSVYDHAGIPTGVLSMTVNALPFRGMNLIWNEWFRDQNLQDSLLVPKGDGPDNANNYVLMKRAKKHDYFTSALPWPQKGAAVALPLGLTAPIFGNGEIPQGHINSGSDFTVRQTNEASRYALRTNTNEAGDFYWSQSQTGLFTDLSEATGATINALRQAMMYQSILELDARGGTRYVEILKAHFNVISPDFRLQRPEFLGSSTTRINQHPVAQNSASVEDSPQANLAAFSTAHTQGAGFSKSFVEHGWVIGFMSARADITYQQGLNRMWSRRTRFDYFFPKLQELGEQPIYRKEIYVDDVENPDEVFGYQERFAEYRYKPSEIRGQFRSSFAETLDVWHLAEEFETVPNLNGTFIQSSTPIERSLVVAENYPHLLIDMWFDYKHARPMMTYGVPATLGRF